MLELIDLVDVAEFTEFHSHNPNSFTIFAQFTSSETITMLEIEIYTEIPVEEPYAPVDPIERMMLIAHSVTDLDVFIQTFNSEDLSKHPLSISSPIFVNNQIIYASDGIPILNVSATYNVQNLN